jgi:hypothetical protein
MDRTAEAYPKLNKLPLSPRTTIARLDVGVPLLSWRERQIMR